MRKHPPIVLSIALSMIAAPAARPQSTAESKSPAAQTTKHLLPDRDEILRQVKVCQDALRNAESIHAAPPTLARIDLMIGDLYAEAGAYPLSEAAYRKALDLYGNAEPENKANALSALAMLHTEMGETGRSEKELLQVLELRKQAGDTHGIMLTQVNLANAEIRDMHFPKAVESGEKAMEALNAEPNASLTDRITVRQTFGSALAGANRCAEAIPMLKDAVGLSTSMFGEGSLAVGMDRYLLGHAAWECGETSDAAGWMQRGIERMKPDLGWGQAYYLKAIGEYAKFLRERGQKEEAAAEERELRMANSVVDARTISSVPVNGLR